MNRIRFVSSMVALIMFLAILVISVEIVFAAANPRAWSLAVSQ